MKFWLIGGWLLCSMMASAQLDTVKLSNTFSKVTMQRYHMKPVLDSIVLLNDLDVSVTLMKVQMDSEGHNAHMAELNYVKSGSSAIMILTATQRTMVQPYHMKYELTFVSGDDPQFSHTITLKVLVDYNS